MELTGQAKVGELRHTVVIKENGRRMGRRWKKGRNDLDVKMEWSDEGF